jgi:hypothetical protein
LSRNHRDTPPAFYLVRLETESLLAVRADLKGKRVESGEEEEEYELVKGVGERTSHQQLPLANVQKQISPLSL